MDGLYHNPYPPSCFKWLTEEEMEELDVIMVSDDSSRGYILDCNFGKCDFYYLYIYVCFIKCNVSFLCISEFPLDFIKCSISFLYILEYSHELHDLHKDYLLVTEENILSDYERHLLPDEGFSKPPPNLVPNLCNKTNCTTHYRNLKLYLNMRLRLTNIHCPLSFNKSPRLKNYNNFNSRQGTVANFDFQKDFFMLMSNAVFGKSFLSLCLFVLLSSYVLIHSMIHSLQVKFIYWCLFVLLCSYVLIRSLINSL